MHYHSGRSTEWFYAFSPPTYPLSLNALSPNYAERMRTMHYPILRQQYL